MGQDMEGVLQGIFCGSNGDFIVLELDGVLMCIKMYICCVLGIQCEQGVIFQLLMVDCVFGGVVICLQIFVGF